MATRSNTEVGSELERRVSLYYEALGFRVTRNEKVAGHQIDLLAEKYADGGATMTIAVDAKHRSGSVGINEVTVFINVARRLFSENKATHAVMVTDSEFTQDARSAVRDQLALRLLTLTELEQDLFNSAGALLRVVRDYESSTIWNEYIDLVVTDNAENDHEAVSYIREWVEKREPLLILSGDFGSGKSTIIERTLYEAAKRRQTQFSAPLPVLLRLRTLRHYPDLWDFVEASLRDNQYISAPRKEFEANMKAGRLLLLLDGFDEINTGASASERAAFLKILSPLLASASPCVLTTRPTYFESLDQMVREFRESLTAASGLTRVDENTIDVSRLMSRLMISEHLDVSEASLANALRIKQLDREQVRGRLEKSAADILASSQMSVDEFESFLYGIYDLEDLMRRPLLLSMVIETVLATKIDIRKTQEKWGPSTLYDTYTQICVKRDIKKEPTSQFLNEEQRLSASRAIALAMFHAGRLQLSGKEVIAAIDKANLHGIPRRRTAERRIALERATTDVRLCTFLRLDDDGSLSFAHKSYMEFFVAQYIFLQIKESPEVLDTFAEWRLDREIFYFLGSYARDLEDFRSMIHLAMRREMPPGRRNLLYSIALASGLTLEGSRLVKGEVANVDLRRASIKSTRMQGTRLSLCRIRDVVATEWIMEDVHLRKTSISRSRFSLSEMALEGDELDLENVDFRAGRLAVSGNNWRLHQVTVWDGRLDVDGEGRMLDVSIGKRSTLSFKRQLTLQAGSVVHVRDSMVLCEALERWYPQSAKVVLENCTLLGLCVDSNDVVGIRSSGVFTLVNCRGALLLDHRFKSKEASVNEVLSRLAVICPGLRLLDAGRVRSELLRGVDRDLRKATGELGELIRIAEELGYEHLLTEGLLSSHVI